MINKVDGVQEILTIMKRFPSSNFITAKGFEALGNIVYLNWDLAQLLVTKIHCIPLLVEQMKRFWRNMEIMVHSL